MNELEAAAERRPSRPRRGAIFAFLLATALPVGAGGSTVNQPPDTRSERLQLTPCKLPSWKEELQCGTLSVPENRATGGRMLPMKVIVIPARVRTPQKEAVFMLAGGPGQATSGSAGYLIDSPLRDLADLVLFDLRGTGEGHALNCRTPGSVDDVQGYFEQVYQKDVFRACRTELEKSADLTQYLTWYAVQDLDEVRAALGYGKIHLNGGSYGTKAALAYLQRYGRNVETAFLSGLSAPSNRAPLYHSAAGQRAFNLLVSRCEAEAACREAYPDLHGDLAAIMQQLRKSPARVEVPHPVTSKPVQISLSEDAFGEALRWMMYWEEDASMVPLLLREARAGSFRRFAETALQTNRGTRANLRYGLHLSVSCSEDVARIRADEIERETAGSFLRDYRVRAQMAACEEWPKARVPAQYLAPFRSNVPTVLVSGNLDPVTPPQWGDEFKKYLPNSIHLVSPSAHTASNACIQSLTMALVRTGKLDGLETSCISEVKTVPFVLPKKV